MSNTGCANELFVSFLLELKKEAQLSGSRVMVQSLTRAIASMKKYPLPLTRGSDARCLDGVGPHIAKSLDDKLEAYLRLHASGELTAWTLLTPR